jgi:hypothetical protein
LVQGVKILDVLRDQSSEFQILEENQVIVGMSSLRSVAREIDLN